MADPLGSAHDAQCESELTSHGYTPCRCAERAAPLGSARALAEEIAGKVLHGLSVWGKGRDQAVAIIESALTRHAADLAQAQAETARLRETLTSIANNSCCPPCQEAAQVARAALKETR